MTDFNIPIITYQENIIT